jgi:Carboxypeptidase regulatory-like domain
MGYMEKRFSIIVGVAACLTLIGSNAVAQSSIAGVVKDTTGGVLPGVTVEASSPALIEKTRTVVTDGSGLYRIVDLRPGIYAVTFRLPGFTAVLREGIELTALFTATVNAEMRVGDVAETLTVSGQAPVVDVQNVVKQHEITRDVLDAIPRGSSAFQNLMTLIPGATGGTQDVGGAAGPQTGLVTFHGGMLRDGESFFDGGKITNLPRNDATNFIAQDETIQEYNVQIGSQSAENETSGTHLNIVPREGANTFHGSVFANFTNGQLESTNYTDELKTSGLGSPSRVKQLFDVNPTFGGRIKQNKLWFYAGLRRWVNERYIAGSFYNKDVTSWVFSPDVNRPGVNDLNGWGANLHLTWQASERNRVRLYYDQNNTCWCHFSLSSTRAPEATQHMLFLNSLRQIAWTAPVTNRLLVEAHASWFPQGNPRDPQSGAVAPSITEQSTGLVYRSGFGVSTDNGVDQYRASASYITGRHAFKVGFSRVYEDMTSKVSTIGDVTYRLLNGVPNQVSYYATPIDYIVFLYNTSLFANDQWTVRRLTLNAGARFDHFTSSNAEINIPAVRYYPFPRQFPETQVTNWNDVSPRIGAAYDLFGTTKTAVKGNVGRYVNQEGNDLTALANPLNPPSCCSAGPVSVRSWNNAAQDFIVHGDPFNPAANGELGPGSDLNFGRSISLNHLDPNLTQGYGVRGHNWEASAGIQHELLPRVSVDYTYYWRWFGNFYLTDNLAVTPADFSPFCVTAPLDPRLPGGGGNQICGLYDVNPGVFGRINNFVTAAKNFGVMQQHWQGYDFTVNARPKNGILLQGGLSSGKTMTDNCDVVTKVNNPSTRFCHTEEPFLTQVKFLGSYALPWWGLQLSGTYQNHPSAPVSANYVATSASVRASLGRDLSTGANGNVVVNLIEPSKVFRDRVNQVDFRLAKVITAGRTRVMGTIDFYNVMNANTVLTWNNSYVTDGSAWLRPLSILDPRLVKFSARFYF